MRQELRERLGREVRDWAHEGLITDELAGVLASRYQVTGGRQRMLLKWLGFFAVFWLGAGVLSSIGLAAASASPFAGALIIGIAAAAIWTLGVRLAADPAGRQRVAGSILLTVGLLGGYAALSVFYLAAGGTRYSDAFPAFMIATAAAAFGTAYRYRLRWPLLLALLLLFHGIGSWHGYIGHGAYVFAIQDERSMALVALVTLLLGRWHEEVLETGPLRRHAGFGHLYLIFGLLYFNLSLWILSLMGPRLGWVLAFTAAGIAQIVAGARLKDPRFTGFGIVFLAIDLYTRMFEQFWDRRSAAAFLAVAGAVGMALGYGFEVLARRERTALAARRSVP
jgi:MFS family permease